MNKSI
ncbi:unnamed protein product, partial [Allacma fusca]